MYGLHKQAEHMNAPADEHYAQNTCARGAVYNEALGEGILHGLTRRDVVRFGAALLAPALDRHGGQLRAVAPAE